MKPQRVAKYFFIHIKMVMIILSKLQKQILKSLMLHMTNTVIHRSIN